jgi:hypothetical protein
VVFRLLFKVLIVRKICTFFFLMFLMIGISESSAQIILDHWEGTVVKNICIDVVQLPEVDKNINIPLRRYKNITSCAKSDRQLKYLTSLCLTLDGNKYCASLQEMKDIKYPLLDTLAIKFSSSSNDLIYIELNHDADGDTYQKTDFVFNGNNIVKASTLKHSR